MKVSVVIPCYYSEKTLRKVVEELVETFATHANDSYEIILVNDASQDATREVIRACVQEYTNVIGIHLSKNFGQHAAVLAGLHHAKGEITICMDDDFQTPGNEIYKLIEKVETSYDVVYARYNHKQHSDFRNFGSRVNDVMAQSLLGKPQTLYISSYFAMKSYVRDEIIRYKNPYPYLAGLILRTTQTIGNVDVHHRERLEGTTTYSFLKLLKLWLNGFTAFSEKPLRLASIIGAGASVSGFMYAIYVVLHKLIHPEVEIGWSSLISVNLILGGLILLMLGLIGEYIGRIYISINNSPQFIVKEVDKNEA